MSRAERERQIKEAQERHELHSKSLKEQETYRAISKILRNYTYIDHRKSAIFQWFLDHPLKSIRVNCKYTPQMSEDADLCKLVKQGKLKQIRIKASSRTSHTHLILNENYKGLK